MFLKFLDKDITINFGLFIGIVLNSVVWDIPWGWLKTIAVLCVFYLLFRVSFRMLFKGV